MDHKLFEPGDRFVQRRPAPFPPRRVYEIRWVDARMVGCGVRSEGDGENWSETAVRITLANFCKRLASGELVRTTT